MSPSTKSNGPQTEAARERRRAATANLLKQGWPYRRMVELLLEQGHDTSLATLSADIKILNERWRTESFRSREESMLLDIARVDNMIQQLWYSVFANPRMPNIEAMEQLRKLMEFRAEILSYKDLSMRERAEDQAIRSLTRDEEAILLMTLQAYREGRPLPQFSPAYQQLMAPVPDGRGPLPGYEDVPRPPGMVIDADFEPPTVVEPDREEPEHDDRPGAVASPDRDPGPADGGAGPAVGTGGERGAERPAGTGGVRRRRQITVGHRPAD